MWRGSMAFFRDLDFVGPIPLALFPLEKVIKGMGSLKKGYVYLLLYIRANLAIERS